jgi:type IV pilus assembly protein PilB
MPDRIQVRYRIDGVLREQPAQAKALQGSLLSRLKLMAGMDIAEKRRPQDGRILIHVGGKELDIRASALPATHGETMVFRILDRERGLKSLEALGFDGRDEERFRRLVKRPHGLLLVTGPTGSGKTTTLYAALQTLNKPNVKILTAEDPVEYHIPGLNQTPIRTPIGLTFARVLRSMLRQAPNIILVGEIRDRETAETAIQAALTGHLVFSTLHTNDAPSAITRLTDMGVPPFLTASALLAAMAQRLVRVVCPDCREAYVPGPVDLRALGLDAERLGGARLHRARGCRACEGTGYRGRLGIFELLEMDETLREMAYRKSPLAKLREQARANGMTTLEEDGVRKVVAGLTTVEEYLRVTRAGAQA